MFFEGLNGASDDIVDEKPSDESNEEIGDIVDALFLPAANHEVEEDGVDSEIDEIAYEYPSEP